MGKWCKEAKKRHSIRMKMAYKAKLKKEMEGCEQSTTDKGDQTILNRVSDRIQIIEQQINHIKFLIS